jgi:hypothetical protein
MMLYNDIYRIPKQLTKVNRKLFIILKAATFVLAAAKFIYT